MKTRSLFFAFLAPTLVALGTGCAAQPGVAVVAVPVAPPPHHVHGAAAAGLAAADMFLAVASIAEATQAAEPSAEQEIDPALDNTGDAQRLLGSGPMPAPPPPNPVHVETPVPFDLGSAYGAIANVDLGSCKEQGLAAGYGRVALSFGNGGTPVRVDVQMPAGSTAAAGPCAQAAFAQVHVAPFTGSAMTVSRAFFVGA